MALFPFQLGIHPINWVGEDVKEHGEHTTYEQILDDIQALGLTGTEMGRKFPTDIELLKQELSKRNIQLVSQWKSVLFSDPAYREAELEAYPQACRVSAGDGKHGHQYLRGWRIAAFRSPAHAE